MQKNVSARLSTIDGHFAKDKPTVIVVGVGTMGSATCAQLADRGAHVIGLERHSIVHKKGSHSGNSRMFRQAYKETADHPGYVPIGQRARELWLELNARTGKDIFYPIGCVTFNHPSMHNDELDVCKLHGLKHELLKKNEWKARWPIFADIPEEWSATYEADGGLINVDLAIQESVEIAKKQGAEIHENVRVVDWKVQGNKVYVHTADKQVFIGDQLVITAGFASEPLAQVKSLKIAPSKQLLFWYDSPKEAPVDHIPVWGMNVPKTGGYFYGFPRMMKGELNGPEGFKTALHQVAPFVDAENYDREADQQDIKDNQELMTRFVPQADGKVNAAISCLYANSIDDHFRIGHHPSSDRVVVASGFGGHGFKFQPAIGELLAELCLYKKTKLDIQFAALEAPDFNKK